MDKIGNDLMRCRLDSGPSTERDGKEKEKERSVPLIPKVPVWPNAGQRLTFDDWTAIYEEDIEEIVEDILTHISSLYERGYEIRYNPPSLFMSIASYLYDTSINTLKKKHVDLDGF